MKQSWKQFPFDWAALFLIGCGAVYCLKTAFDLQVPAPIWLWCLMLTGIFCALFRLDKGWIAVLAGFVLLTLGCLYFRNTMVENGSYLGRLILERLGNAYAWIGSRLSIQEPGAPIDLSPIFLALSALLSLLLCLFTVRLQALVPTLLTGFFAIAPCYFITNTPPKAVFLLIALFGMLLLVFSHNARKYLPEEAHRSAAYAFLPALIALALVLLLFPEREYEPPFDPNSLTEKLSAFGEELAENLPSGTETAVREQVRVDNLGPKLQRRYTALTVTVRGDYSDILYLRGMAYEGFDGNVWTLGPNTESDSALLESSAFSDSVYDVAIHVPTAGKLLYTPPRLVDPGLETVFDYYVPNTEQTRDYTFQMYTEASRPDPQILSRLREDAYANCLSLPEQTRNNLRRIAEENGIATASDTRALTEKIISFVRNSAAYDLSPERPPEDQDFCTWFLSEAEDGYCVHFATAATALLRSVGVPARYVEGYLTRAVPYEPVNVEARQAHAWVEVFLDFDGWVRFDPTPSEGVSATADPYSVTEATEESGTEESEAPTEASEQQDPEKTEPSEKPEETASQTQEAENPEPEKAPRSLLGLWILLSVLALIGACVLTRVLRRRHRRLQYARADRNGKALLSWKRYAKLCRVNRCEPDAAVEDLAKKARFSQHALSDAEFGEIRSALQDQIGRLRLLPLPKRLWYSYWLL